MESNSILPGQTNRLGHRDQFIIFMAADLTVKKHTIEHVEVAVRLRMDFAPGCPGRQSPLHTIHCTACISADMSAQRTCVSVTERCVPGSAADIIAYAGHAC